MTLHYHGTPITPRERLLALAGRSFCVSFADPRDVAVCHQIGQSVMLDNGAYTAWTQGRAVDWEDWFDWAEPWLDYPTTWCVLPDSIEGGEEENDELLSEWGRRAAGSGVPVWHLHESLGRLQRLVATYGRVCFGSSREYAQVGTDRWHRRVSAAFDVLVDGRGRVPWVHMLRGLALAGSHYPFASVDSTNVARNHKGSWRQQPRLITEFVAEIDARQCPGRWQKRGTQTELEVA